MERPSNASENVARTDSSFSTLIFTQPMVHDRTNENIPNQSILYSASIELFIVFIVMLAREI